MQQYEWEDIEAGARSMLFCFGDDADLSFAKGIWDLLEKGGLTSYNNEIGRHRVLIRLLALVEFVNDCTALIREDSYELDLPQWASEVGMNDFRIAQLVSEDFGEEDDCEKGELIEMALLELTSYERRCIIKTIRKTHINDVAIMQFIGAFYEEPSDFEQDYDTMVELYGEPTISVNVQEFSMWIMNGMERRN